MSCLPDVGLNLSRSRGEHTWTAPWGTRTHTLCKGAGRREDQIARGKSQCGECRRIRKDVGPVVFCDSWGALEKDPPDINPAKRIKDGELAWVLEIRGPGEIGVSVHQGKKPVYQVIHEAERAGLLAVSVYGDGFVTESLHDEIGDHSAVGGVHARAVCIEDARHLDGQTMLATVVEEESLGAALAFVV